MDKLYIIESRHPDGTLDLSAPQPESKFGNAAIHGITEDQMARRIFRDIPNASMQGDSISQWPSLIDPRWKARRKTW